MQKILFFFKNLTIPFLWIKHFQAFVNEKKTHKFAEAGNGTFVAHQMARNKNSLFGLSFWRKLSDFSWWQTWQGYLVEPPLIENILCPLKKTCQILDQGQLQFRQPVHGKSKNILRILAKVGKRWGQWGLSQICDRNKEKSKQKDELSVSKISCLVAIVLSLLFCSRINFQTLLTIQGSRLGDQFSDDEICSRIW